ncbi:hypothetical protein ACN2C7_12750 [Caulobacter sp. ErkDOM-E]|uniref:hypothetical protein n=1 Tax=Caulobacter sp. ErkDOM-E TaxID=3402778 RepID=UPI003AF66341
MIRVLGIVILLTVLPATAWSGKGNRSGFYDNLRYIDEADDYVGARLDVRDGPNPTVEFELCEGWCNGAEVFPARILGDQIQFTYLSRWIDQAGAAGADAIPVSGRFVRRGVMLKVGDAPPELLRLRRAKAN